MTSGDETEKKRRKAERRDEMVRLGARLPKRRAAAVQERLDSDNLAQQQVGEYLFTAYGYGLLDFFELMRGVHEYEQRHQGEE
jgi:hypothetical protein